jgi:hypothetical protein
VLDRAQAAGQVVARVALAHLDRQGSLAWGARPRAEAEQVGHRGGAAESAETGGGQQDGVQVVLETTEARVDVAPDRHDLEVGTAREQLRDTARRAGADLRALRQGLEGEAVASAERVAGVGPARDRPDVQPGVGGGGQVLEGVHEHVALVGEQRLAQRAGEHAGAAEREGLARRLGAVALGVHADELDVVAGRGREALGDRGGLRDGQRAGPGAYSECRHAPTAPIPRRRA